MPNGPNPQTDDDMMDIDPPENNTVINISDHTRKGVCHMHMVREVLFDHYLLAGTNEYLIYSRTLVSQGQRESRSFTVIW